MTGISNEGNSPDSYKEPGIGWMTSYLFLTCFVGLFVLIPLRKVFIYIYFNLLINQRLIRMDFHVEQWICRF